MYFELEQLLQKLTKLEFNDDSIESVEKLSIECDDSLKEIHRRDFFNFDSLESVSNQLKSEVLVDSITDGDEELSNFSCDSLNYQSLKHVQTSSRENFHIGCQHTHTSIKKEKDVIEEIPTNIFEFLIMLGKKNRFDVINYQLAQFVKEAMT